jgi:5-methylcytosine-specific restriction endonuclease McrA
MADDDVTWKAGIYPYVLDGDERHLNIRAFTDNMKREAYERQKGTCPKCGKQYELDEMEGDHIKPWREGGKTVASNCQMLCKDDNRRKSGR